MTAPPPPPLPYQGGPPGWYPPPPPRKKTKWWVLGGIVLAVLMVIVTGAVVLLVITSDGDVTATEVEVGTCLAEIPTGAEVSRLKTVDCDQTHAGEVFALLTIPDGDFPGRQAIDAFATKLCAGTRCLLTPIDDRRRGAALCALPHRRNLGRRRSGGDLHCDPRPAAHRFDKGLIPRVPFLHDFGAL